MTFIIPVSLLHFDVFLSCSRVKCGNILTYVWVTLTHKQEISLNTPPLTQPPHLKQSDESEERVWHKAPPRCQIKVGQSRPCHDSSVMARRRNCGNKLLLSEGVTEMQRGEMVVMCRRNRLCVWAVKLTLFACFFPPCFCNTMMQREITHWNTSFTQLGRAGCEYKGVIMAECS